MDSLLFHPKLVHLPIALGVLMPLIAAGLALAWWRGWLPARAWTVAVLLQAALVGSGALALRSGEAEEERVEAVVAEAAIERHEEAAEAFVWGAAAVLVAMAGAGLAARTRAGLPLAAVAVAGSLGVLALGYRTGQEGGELVYTHGAAQAYVASGGGAAASPGRRTHAYEDDDD